MGSAQHAAGRPGELSPRPKQAQAAVYARILQSVRDQDTSGAGERGSARRSRWNHGLEGRVRGPATAGDSSTNEGNGRWPEVTSERAGPSSNSSRRMPSSSKG